MEKKIASWKKEEDGQDHSAIIRKEACLVLHKWELIERKAQSADDDLDVVDHFMDRLTRIRKVLYVHEVSPSHDAEAFIRHVELIVLAEDDMIS